MKKFFNSFLIFCLIFLLSLCYSHNDVVSKIYNESIEASSYISTGTFVGDEELLQDFSVKSNTLNAVSFKIDYVGNVQNVVLNYKILDEKAALLREGSVKAEELVNQEFNTLEFDTINNANNKKLTLVLSETNADAENGISFSLTPLRQNGEDLIIKGNATDATLVASFESSGFDIETFAVVFCMLSFVIVFMKVLFKLFK